MTTAPVFLCAELHSGEVRLGGDEGRHAAGVRRLTIGERVDLVDGTGRRGRGVVLVVHGREALTVAVESVSEDPVPDPAFVVVQALPKGDRGELAVELMTEAGVDEVIPWSATRCVTRWSGDRGQRSLARWRSSAAEAAKQSRRSRWPVVGELAGTAAVALRCAAADAAYVLHEDAETSLAALPALPALAALPALPALAGPELPTAPTPPNVQPREARRREILVIVGPEGGIEAGELAAFSAAGANSVRLGSEILRTSTAGIVALAVLSSTQRWSS